MKSILLTGVFIVVISALQAQHKQEVKFVKAADENKIAVYIDGKLFTNFMYPQTMEKPVLIPVYTAGGTELTRGFPPKPGEATDHPHHIGIWFSFENVNGIDFWNNSAAIPAEKKSNYGWIKTDKITSMKDGKEGALSYHSNWVTQQNNVLLEENTTFIFSGEGDKRIIDRTTTLIADTTVLFKDAKDGLLGMRVIHALQIPETKDQQFTDDKGNVTIVKKTSDSTANGNYITSENKQGNDAWSTRAAWCKLYGKVGNDSVSITMIDHPGNVNYPTFWHARGYGLFAANPLGENIFTNGKSSKNITLKKGEKITFHYRIIIQEGKQTISTNELNIMAKAFAQLYMN
jgi:hypothetical protein